MISKAILNAYSKEKAHFSQENCKENQNLKREYRINQRKNGLVKLKPNRKIKKQKLYLGFLKQTKKKQKNGESSNFFTNKNISDHFKKIYQELYSYHKSRIMTIYQEFTFLLGMLLFFIEK